MSGQAAAPEPRSLNQLTGEKNIFAILHSHFAWLLWAGSRYFTETVTVGCPLTPATANDVFPTSSLKVIDKDYLLKNFSISDASSNTDEDDELEMEDVFNLKKCRKILRSDFVSACYCAIVGIQVK
jgi:folliculin